MGIDFIEVVDIDEHNVLIGQCHILRLVTIVYSYKTEYKTRFLFFFSNFDERAVIWSPIVSGDAKSKKKYNFEQTLLYQYHLSPVIFIFQSFKKAASIYPI